MRFSLIEYGVINFPPGLEGWGMFRIEYGGHAEDCLAEGHIWLPPWINPRDWEADMRKIMAEPKQEQGK